MATKDYSGKVALARRLITKFGKQVSLHKKTTTGGTAWSPEKSNDPEQITVVDLDIEKKDGSSKRTLYICVPLSSSVVPEQGDKVVMPDSPTVKHELHTCKPLNPGGTVIMWEATIET